MLEQNRLLNGNAMEATNIWHTEEITKHCYGCKKGNEYGLPLRDSDVLCRRPFTGLNEGVYVIGGEGRLLLVGDVLAVGCAFECGPSRTSERGPADGSEYGSSGFLFMMISATKGAFCNSVAGLLVRGSSACNTVAFLASTCMQTTTTNEKGQRGGLGRHINVQRQCGATRSPVCVWGNRHTFSTVGSDV
jgi:hypothetical protein